MYRRLVVFLERQIRAYASGQGLYDAPEAVFGNLAQHLAGGLVDALPALMEPEEEPRKVLIAHCPECRTIVDIAGDASAVVCPRCRRSFFVRYTGDGVWTLVPLKGKSRA